MELDYEFTKNLVLVVLPTIIGIIGSKLLVNSWQIRKEKFALRKDILVNFQETWPSAASIIYGLYLKIGYEFSELDPNAEYEHGTIATTWSYPTTESEKPFNKFNEDLQKLSEQLSQISHKVNGFRGLIVLYFETSKNVVKLFDELETDIHGYYLRVNRMILSKNIDDLVIANDELLEMRPAIRKKIHNLEKTLIETKLKNPKT